MILLRQTCIKVLVFESFKGDMQSEVFDEQQTNEQDES